MLLTVIMHVPYIFVDASSVIGYMCLGDMYIVQSSQL